MRNTTYTQAHRALCQSLYRWLRQLRNAQYYNNYKNKNRDTEHSIPTAVMPPSLELKGLTGQKELVKLGAEMQSHKAHRQKNRIKTKTNMDYYIRTQYIHDMT